MKTMTTKHAAHWSELRDRLQEINDLANVNDLLGWDQQVMMPPAGGAARGQQMGTIGRLAHEKLIDPAVGRLLDTLEAATSQLAYEDDDAALLRVVRRQFDRARRIPPAFTAEMAAHWTAIYARWSAARPANDFSAVQPLLEHTLVLSRRYAEFFPAAAHIADPLIEASDYGMSVALLRPLFADL